MNMVEGHSSPGRKLFFCDIEDIQDFKELFISY